MDGRRHSVDFPISRTLVALRRVRSLRDPPTNSMTKLSNLNWETKSSNSITLGFNNGGTKGCNESNHELSCGSGFHDSGLVLCESGDEVRNTGLDNRKMVCEGLELSDSKWKENGDQELEINQMERRLMQAEKRCRGPRGRVKRNRKHNRLSRVTAGDSLSPVVSPCLSVNDTPGCRLPNPQTNDCEEHSEGVARCLEPSGNLCQKFMPKSFKELVGQDVVVNSILNAISNGGIASLFIFHGPRGIGKTSAARVFAAALNCLSSEFDKPCGLCNECVSFFSGMSRDVKEVDSVAINSINNLRLFITNSDNPSVFSRFKVYIFDECHLLQEETWEAILDKLVELPQNVVFVMVTPDLDKLPIRAVSKSQRYQFQTVKVADITCRLGMICEEEGIDFDEDALNVIAMKSSGSVRDAEMMLDQMSLLSKKITMSLVYEVNGVVSNAELVDLLHLALSSDASNTIKKAREITRSRIDPLQLISQLANLIMNILSGRCEGAIEFRRKLFGPDNSEADMQQLRDALKILSETEKQLRTSKNQTTWLTVALLQLSSARVSHDTNLQDGDFHGSCLKHPVTSSCENVVQDDMETLELIWIRAIGICKSSSIKNFLQKRGKLVSVHLNQGVAVAEIEFDHSKHASKAEKSWKEIAGALQLVLGYNVELRINLASNASRKYERPSFSFSNCCAECGSNPSEYSCNTPTPFITRDRYVETCSSDCGSQISHTCCHGNEMVKSIRNADGNALSIGVRTPSRSLPDSMERKNWHCNHVKLKPESRSRQGEYWKLCCWRAAIFPFRKAQSLLEKKLY